MLAQNNNDGTWTIIINEFLLPNQLPSPLTIIVPNTTTPHQLWQQILAACAANGIHLIPAMVAINASGTTGTILS